MKGERKARKNGVGEQEVHVDRGGRGDRRMGGRKERREGRMNGIFYTEVIHIYFKLKRWHPILGWCSTMGKPFFKKKNQA